MYDDGLTGNQWKMA